MDLFTEYKDSKFSLNLTKILVMLTLVLAIFLSIFAGDALPQATSWYLIMSALVIFFIAQTEKETKNELFNANFFGDDKAKMYLILLLGLALGAGIGFMQRGASNPLDMFGLGYLPTQGIELGGVLSPIFANIVAPILEALFWRGVAFPTVLAFSTVLLGTKNRNVAILLALAFTAYGFAFFHIKAYNQGDLYNTFTLIETAVFFAMMFTGGTYLFKTISFEMGWHFSNNLFSAGMVTNPITHQTVCSGCYSVTQIILAIIAFVAVFAIIAEFADRTAR